MSSQENNKVSRRSVLKGAAGTAAASALAGVVLPQVHAGESNTINVALIGCGGRGTGAAIDALNTRQGPTRLTAVADVFQNRLTGSLAQIQRAKPQQVDVPEARRFVGFDAYRRAMDTLREGDVAILATPPAFRWVMFAYAIEKGLNVFMEKPISVDGPSTKRMLALGEQSVRRGLKVGVGLMCRHCDARGELFTRVKDGQLGDLLLLRAYRMAGPTATAFSLPRPADIPELHYQIQRFHSFLWLSGGAYSDFLIHNIDEACWMKDAWPVSARGSGGRHYRGNFIDQNFDSYSTEFTYADGTKFFLEGRTVPGCHNEFATYIHGSRAAAVVSQSGHAPSRCRIFRGQNVTNNADVVWRFGREEPNPYQLEWDHLMDSIRRNRPHNEVQRGAEASLATAMGRMACHTGQVITREQMLNCDHEFAPNVAELTMDGPSPLRAGADGKYAIPQPGVMIRPEGANSRREY